MTTRSTTLLPRAVVALAVGLTHAALLALLLPTAAADSGPSPGQKTLEAASPDALSHIPLSHIDALEALINGGEALLPTDTPPPEAETMDAASLAPGSIFSEVAAPDNDAAELADPAPVDAASLAEKMLPVEDFGGY